MIENRLATRGSLEAELGLQAVFLFTLVINMHATKVLSCRETEERAFPPPEQEGGRFMINSMMS